MHSPSEEESDNSKDSFYEELEQIFYHFLKYHIKLLLGDFNANWGEGIFSNRKLGMTVHIKTVTV